MHAIIAGERDKGERNSSYGSETGNVTKVQCIGGNKRNCTAFSMCTTLPLVSFVSNEITMICALPKYIHVPNPLLPPKSTTKATSTTTQQRFAVMIIVTIIITGDLVLDVSSFSWWLSYCIVCLHRMKRLHFVHVLVISGEVVHYTISYMTRLFTISRCTILNYLHFRIAWHHIKGSKADT